MINVERQAFAKALDLASSVVDSRRTVPVLGTVRIAANGNLQVVGSDLDTTAKVELAYEGDEMDPICLSDPRRVRAAINAAGGANITIGQPSEKRIPIESGRLAASLSTLPGDDHPGIHRIGEDEFSVELGAEALTQLERISKAISTEETRYYLNGVVVHHLADWTYRFAATDGHRLMRVDIPLPGAVGTIPDGTIIPRRVLAIVFARMRKIDGPIRLRYGPAVAENTPDKDLAPAPKGGPRIEFASQMGDLRLSLASKLIDGHFPDYSRVIPNQSDFALRLSRSKLSQAIHALSALASEKTRAVKLSVEGSSVRLSLNSPDLGEGTYILDAEHKLPNDFSIGFNGNYLLDCLSVLTGDEVLFALTDSSSPAVITDPADTEFLSVLMPMRV